MCRMRVPARAAHVPETGASTGVRMPRLTAPWPRSFPASLPAHAPMCCPCIQPDPPVIRFLSSSHPQGEEVHCLDYGPANGADVTANVFEAAPAKRVWSRSTTEAVAAEAAAEAEAVTAPAGAAGGAGGGGSSRLPYLYLGPAARPVPDPLVQEVGARVSGSQWMLGSRREGRKHGGWTVCPCASRCGADGVTTAVQAARVCCAAWDSVVGGGSVSSSVDASHAARFWFQPDVGKAPPIAPEYPAAHPNFTCLVLAAHPHLTCLVLAIPTLLQFLVWAESRPYHAVTNNCIHFADVLLRLLTTPPPPATPAPASPAAPQAQSQAQAPQAQPSQAQPSQAHTHLGLYPGVRGGPLLYDIAPGGGGAVPAVDSPMLVMMQMLMRMSWWVCGCGRVDGWAEWELTGGRGP